MPATRSSTHRLLMQLAGALDLHARSSPGAERLSAVYECDGAALAEYVDSPRGEYGSQEERIGGQKGAGARCRRFTESSKADGYSVMPPKSKSDMPDP